MPSPWYLAACILVPAIWGLIVAAVYEALALRRKHRRESEEDEFTVYSDFEI